MPATSPSAISRRVRVCSLRLLCAALAVFQGGQAAAQISAERFAQNPILSVASVGPHTAFNYDRGGNHTPFVSLAGPSLIRVPDWIEQPLGSYYLYFAHHKGGHIRMAYADKLQGPWQVYQSGRGVLRLRDMLDFAQDHVASPDVHVDHDAQRIRMYVHSPVASDIGKQRTFLAESEDGLNFAIPSAETLGKPYFRTFRHGGYEYTPSRKGPMYRSQDGFSNFEAGPILFPTPTRHYAVHVHHNTAFVFFSTINDAPERIKLARIDLSLDWSQWNLGQVEDILLPTEPYETSHGARLLDPCIYEEEGRFYLLYSVSAERGIAIARLGVPEWNGQNVNQIAALSCAPYRLAAATLSVGQSLWLDRPETVQALPQELNAGLFIQTAHSDRHSAGPADFLHLRLSRPATLYVLHDSRLSSLPAWLDGWTSTALVVDVGTPFGLRVLSKNVPAGPVHLGGNTADGTPFVTPRFMYSVVIGH